jgi:hypothetical protein
MASITRMVHKQKIWEYENYEVRSLRELIKRNLYVEFDPSTITIDDIAVDSEGGCEQSSFYIEIILPHSVERFYSEGLYEYLDGLSAEELQRIDKELWNTAFPSQSYPTRCSKGPFQLYYTKIDQYYDKIPVDIIRKIVGKPLGVPKDGFPAYCRICKGINFCTCNSDSHNDVPDSDKLLACLDCKKSRGLYEHHCHVCGEHHANGKFHCSLCKEFHDDGTFHCSVCNKFLYEGKKHETCKTCKKCYIAISGRVNCKSCIDKRKK